jgi:hypothetical protein
MSARTGWICLLLAAAAAQHDFESTAELTKYPVFAVADSKDAGVTTEIGAPQKFSGNPLWEQDRGWEERIDNGYPNVIHDPSDPLGAWRMWYGFGVWEYATSTDGLKWTKPDLGQYDLGQWSPRWAKYGKHNNCIMRGEGMGIYKDAHEKDPSRRFKAFGGPACFYGKGAGSPGCTGSPDGPGLVQGVAVSPDGLNWYGAENVTWPYDAGDPSGRHHKYDTHNNLFWDSGKGRYVATTRDLKPFPNRAVAVTESYADRFAFDTADEPPAVLTGTANEQPYSQITFPYYGVYLGLTSVFDAQYGTTQGRMHLRLSWSPDAETWHWVDEGGLTGRDFIPLGDTSGGANPFDSHIIFAAAYPVKLPGDGAVRVYYMGGNGPHGGARNSSFALANLRPDGFASVAGTGTVRTRAVRCTGPTLVVTADVAAGGSVRVGVAGAEGLAPSDAAPVTRDATDHTISFTAGKTLAGLVGKDVVLELVLDRAAAFTVGFKSD